MKLLHPTPDQKTAAEPRHSAWVAANAGSGKTHVLVDRVIRLMLAGTEPAAILCLTFTKAAAAEMASRLHGRLGGWAALPDDELARHLEALGEDPSDPAVLVRARRLFTRALETPGGLKIQTIHAFCERLLQLFPVEAGLAPGFRVMDEREASELHRAAQETVLHEAASAAPGPLADAYATVMHHATATAFPILMRQALSGRSGLSRLLASPGGVHGAGLVLRHSFGFAPGDGSAALRRDILKPDAGWATLAKALAAASESSLTKAARKIAAFMAGRDDEDRLAALIDLFFTTTNTPRKGTITTRKFHSDHPAAAQFLDDMQTRLVNLLTRHDELVRIEASEALYTIAAAILTRVAALKQQRAAHDFDDLIARAEALLTESRLAGWVLYKLDFGLEHILVDEAQDTSPRQWSIVTALAQEFFAGEGRPHARPRTVFVVGDHKQSIYSFQGADVSAFDAAQSHFTTLVSATGQTLSLVNLTISYRTVQPLLDVVDQTFAEGSAAMAGLERPGASSILHQSERMGKPGVFEIWPLVEPVDEAEPEPWDAPVDREPAQSPRRRLARRLAQLLAQWLGQGRIIAAEGRAVKPGDILILVQRRNALFGALVAELRRAGVPVAGADRLKLMENIAILDLLALGQWLLLPEDDHGLACVLKSPLVPSPMDDDALTTLAAGRGSASLWQRLEAAGDAAAQANAAALGRWRQLGPGVRPYDLFAGVLTAQRRAIAARLGSEALDATDALLELALGYEEDHGASLSGFLTWFAEGETEIRREMDKGEGEVRLMTVHGAKGLEANIVILPDAADPPRGGGRGGLAAIPEGQAGAGLPLWAVPHLVPSPVLDRWQEAAEILALRERNRLLYVAMTRARDELYVGGVASAKGLPARSWYERLHQVFVEGPGREMMRPVPSPEGEILRHGPDPLWGPAAAVAGEAPSLPPWATISAVAEARPRTRAVTTLAKAGSPPALGAVQQALKRGSAIHLLLQELPDLDEASRPAYAARKGRRLGLSDEDVAGLLALMDQPELKPLFAPGGGAQSEVSFRARLSGGEALLGQVDRLLVTPAAITVLDYKSDVRPPDALGATHPYVRQMALYAQALAAAHPGRTVHTGLLWTSTGRVDWLSPPLLEQARAEMSQAD